MKVKAKMDVLGQYRMAIGDVRDFPDSPTLQKLVAAGCVEIVKADSEKKPVRKPRATKE